MSLSTLLLNKTSLPIECCNIIEKQVIKVLLSECFNPYKQQRLFPELKVQQKKLNSYRLDFVAEKCLLLMLNAFEYVNDNYNLFALNFSGFTSYQNSRLSELNTLLAEYDDIYIFH